MDNPNYLNTPNENASKPFPYLVREVAQGRSTPRDPGFHLMHWHDDIQFLYVAEGSIRLQTLQDTTLVQAGEAIFINQRVVHLVVSSDDSHYFNLLFPANLLQFYPGCPANDDIAAVLDAKRLPICPLSVTQDWCRPALQLLEELAGFTRQKPIYYTYEVLLRLFQLLLLLRQHCQLSPGPAPNVEVERTRCMLQYIAAHYAEDISLESLAQSACCSKSSCLHAFQHCMQTTPYKYLLDYRLQQAASQLRHTTEPIGNIATAVGFHQFSLFGKYFKARTGYTPTEYRRKK